MHSSDQPSASPTGVSAAAPDDVLHESTLVDVARPLWLIVLGLREALDCPPAEFAAMHATTPLAQLVERITEAYKAKLPNGADHVETCLAPLRAAIDRPVVEILKDQAARDTYQALSSRKLGETCLGDWYAG